MPHVLKEKHNYLDKELGNVINIEVKVEKC